MKLNTRPSGNVTVAVARNGGGDADLTASATALTFTAANWSTAQTVTVSAATDADGDNGTATFSHTPVGGGYDGVAAASVTATEADGDTRGVTVAPTALSVPEGGSQNYTVKLNTRPSGNVTISVANDGGRRRPHGVGDRTDFHRRELEHRADRNGIRRDGRGRRQWNRDILPHPGRRRL